MLVTTPMSDQTLILPTLADTGQLVDHLVAVLMVLPVVGLLILQETPVKVAVNLTSGENAIRTGFSLFQSVQC